MSDMDVYVDEHRSNAELIMAVQSTAMAVQNLLLSAHEMGLGACWRCAPLFCAKTVIDTLKLPQSWRPQALVTLGYPDEVRQYLTEIDIYALPTGMDTTPLSCREAMAMKKPIIGTRVGGIP